MIKQCCFIVSLFTLSLPLTVSANELNLKIDKDVVKWGEIFSLEIEATNPLDQTMRGGITVSFSSNVIVLEQDPETKIYYEGSEVMKVGHKPGERIFTQQIMVENWYEYAWPAHEQRTMRLKVFALKTGVLEVSYRAAILISAKRSEVIAIPNEQQSLMRDQQKYPVYRKTVLVEESPDFLRNFQLLINDPRISESSDFSRNLQALLNDPTNQDAGKYFGLGSIKNSLDYLAHLKTLINNPNVRDSPYLMDYLRKLINNPMNPDALEFFGIKIITEEETQSEKDLRQTDNDARAFLWEKRCGQNLYSLIVAEGDLRFVQSRSSKYLTICRLTNGYCSFNQKYEFFKDDLLVPDLARYIIKIKPDSLFINQDEPMSETSYQEILEQYETLRP